MKDFQEEFNTITNDIRVIGEALRDMTQDGTADPNLLNQNKIENVPAVPEADTNKRTRSYNKTKIAQPEEVKEKFNSLDLEKRKNISDNFGDKSIFDEEFKIRAGLKLGPKYRKEFLNFMKPKKEEIPQPEEAPKEEIVKKEETKPQPEVKPELKQELPKQEIKPEETPEVKKEEPKQSDDMLYKYLINPNISLNNINNKFGNLITEQIRKISDKKTIDTIFKAIVSNKKLTTALFNSIPGINRGEGLNTFFTEKMPFFKKSTTNYKIAEEFFNEIPMNNKLLLKLRIYQNEQALAKGDKEAYNKMFQFIKMTLDNSVNQFISGPKWQEYIDQVNQEMSKPQEQTNTVQQTKAEQPNKQERFVANKFSRMMPLNTSHKVNMNGLKYMMEKIDLD